MLRHILGVVAATVAAPYLIVIFAEFPFDKTDSSGLLFGINVATGALMFFGIPTLILASICAAILHRLKLQTRGCWAEPEWAWASSASYNCCPAPP